jgi:hypothetical protein
MMNRVSIAVFITVFLTACAGTDFKKVEINQLAYGSDTPETIKQKLGEPYGEGTVTKNEKQFKTMSFVYASTGGSAAYKGVTAARSQGFYFFQNKLVGHEFTSSFAIDSTDFDESKVSEIKEGSTTIQEVIELLGGPGGEWVYPLVKNANEKAKIYLYSHMTGSAFAFNLKFYRKSLVVTHDENGIVTEVTYASSGTKSGEKHTESIETPVLASQSNPEGEKSTFDYYGQAEEEINTQTYDKNLWAKALVETEGDQTKRKARYIELRANQLYIEKGGSASDTSLYQQAAPVTPYTPIDISDISGTYISDITSNKKVFFGNTDGKLQFTLEQDGDRITAVNSTHDLKIGGTRKGNIIEFFVEPHRMNSFQDQNGVWRIKLDGINITGFWKVKNWRGAGQWNLRRIE